MIEKLKASGRDVALAAVAAFVAAFALALEGGATVPVLKAGVVAALYAAARAAVGVIAEKLAK